MSWRDVRRWRDALRAAAPPLPGLSPPGSAAAWEAALGALDDDALDAVASIDGEPFPDAVVTVAGTVGTAPVEWCAVLLGRGTRVTLKHPSGAPGVTGVLVRAARDAGLPLAATDDRAVITRAPLVVAMGSDATIAAIRRAAQASARILTHGHRFSAAWIREDFDAVAEDAALHDGRGCLSPVVVLTPLPLDAACDALAEAMRRAEARLPLGDVAPGEAAALRARRALAKATGTVREGPGWSVHGVPGAHIVPSPLPRSLALVHAPDARAAARLLAPFGAALSTVGTDTAPDVRPFVEVGATRVCPAGRMQRPPLLRPHDGEDWIRATLRLVSREL